MLSPIPLIGLTAATSEGVLPASPNAATFFGVTFIIAMVAVGVLMLVRSGRHTSRYAHVVDSLAPVPTEVSTWANSLAQQRDTARSRALQFAIGLWICAPVPLLGFAFLGSEDPLQPLWVIFGVIIILILVASGLCIYLPQCWAHELAQTLKSRATNPLHRSANDEEHGIVSVIASVNWPVIVLAFLLWSFIGDAWGISWIIWPVATLLFGAISGGVNTMTTYRTHKRSRA